MLSKVHSFIEKNQLLAPDAPVLVGVSGGVDSVVLLHVLLSLGYKCVVAHCNFHLRGEESNRDELFVRELSEKYKLPFYKIDFDTVAYACGKSISIEMAARDLRYEWFDKLRLQHIAQAVAVAHHADDDIETLLMNLIRGTGLKGLTGISSRNGNVVRPLLCLSRSEIECYATDNGLESVLDSTNASSDYQRNKIRNEVLPLLEEINPSVRSTLYSSLHRFEESYQIYLQSIDDIAKWLVNDDGDAVKIDIAGLKSLAGMIDTVLFELLKGYGFNSSLAQQIVLSLDADSGRVFYSETHQLLKDRDKLIITKRKSIEPDVVSVQKGKSGISYPFKMNFKVFEKPVGFEVSRSKTCIHVDADKIEYPLVLRHWKPGDAFYPYGMKGKKKLSDFFVDSKLNRIEKDNCWLLISGNEIIWVIGYRTDDRFKVDERTKKILEIKC